MAKYASNTTVPVSRSKQEIESILTRYGANKFASLSSEDKAMIQFQINDRTIRFTINLPDRSEFKTTPARGYYRTPEEVEKHWEQGCRQKWRALLLVIKAKLEAIDAEIVEFDQEFMAHIVLPGGQTMSEKILPEMKQLLETGTVPPLLLGF